MWLRAFFLTILLSSFSLKAEEIKDKYVTVRLMGQLGNQLFQIATAYAYALDHKLPMTIPDLVNSKGDGIPHNAEALFLNRINSQSPSKSPKMRWSEPTFNYNKIPDSSSIALTGYFQSEKYFKHRKNEILSLFAAPEGMNEKILRKYPFLDSDKLIVGVQIRDYRAYTPTGAYHPTHQRSYYEKAMSVFPKDTIFVVSSNNPELAKSCTQGLSKNIVYLNADYIEEFYTLVLCKSFIISNSSFGWWASWLSTSDEKVCIAPSPWFALPYNDSIMSKDILPSEYLVIQD